MSITVRKHDKFDGVYLIATEDGSTKLATLNLAPGRSVYGERLIVIDDNEYRLWDPYKSKLAAAILRNIPAVPINSGNRVLYLGAASGTTVSHVSDIVGEDGCVYCVELSFRSLRDLLSNVCTFRRMVFPILADARFPDNYRILLEQVDVIYCDVAQSEQAKILADNAAMFLKAGGIAMLAIKARSIDATKSLSEIFRGEVDVLKEKRFKIRNITPLKPYDKAHTMVTAEFLG
jgi:fibrillarin-like pre-rRNA processing protein